VKITHIPVIVAEHAKAIRPFTPPAAAEASGMIKDIRYIGPRPLREVMRFSESSDSSL
jgi:hypothetical protein